MKKIVIYSIMLLILLLGNEARAQGVSSSSISKTGTTVAQFLKIGVSARSIGMGGAFVAVADDISAAFVNPAGLATAGGYQVLFTHTDWLVDTDYEFGAVSLDLREMGTIAVMVSAFNSGDMEVRTIESPDGTGELFSTNDFLIGLSYARNLTDNFSIGFTGKYISQSLWHMDASSFALDVGLLFKTPFWGVNFGASISNFGSKMQLQGRDGKFAYDPDNRNVGTVDIVNAQYEMLSYSLPLYFQVGLAKNLIDNDTHRFTIAVDAVTPNDNYEAINSGFEYGWKDMLFIRGGYKSLLQDDTEEGLTAGFGLNIRLAGTTKLQLDYAYADFGRFERVDRFSLSMKF